MKQSTQVLIALAAGLIGGAVIQITHNALGTSLVALLEPAGILWLNALRMIVVPLVVSAIITGTTSLPDARAIGRLGGRSFIVASLFIIAAAAFATLLAPLALAGLHIDAAASAALRESAATSSGETVKSAQQLIGVSQWLVSLVPINPIKAAADGTMLPLIVFTIALGVALARVKSANREKVVGVFQGVFDACITIMRWVMVLAPLGVFALTLPFAHRLGFAAAGAVLYYISTVAVMCGIVMIAMYLLAWLVGGYSPRVFARACAPAQAIAISARSSLAALPATVEGAEKVLDLPFAIRTFFLPLAAAVFKTGSAVMIPVGAVFMAKLYGVELTPAAMLSIAFVTYLTTFSVPGVPGGTVIVMVPVLSTAGLPLSAIGLLVGVDAIPDMVRTVTHVTGTMSAATILSRYERISAARATQPPEHYMPVSRPITPAPDSLGESAN